MSNRDINTIEKHCNPQRASLKKPYKVSDERGLLKDFRIIKLQEAFCCFKMSFGIASFFFLNIKCDQYNLRSTLNFPTWQPVLFQAILSDLKHRCTGLIQRLSENWKHPIWDPKNKSLALSQQGSFGGCSLYFFFS